MTRKTCTDNLYIDIVVKLCRELLHKSLNKAWESSSPGSEDLHLFLKENGIKLEEIQPFIQMTRNKMPRTRAASMCYKIKHSPLSPAADYGHRLRKRRHTAYNNHFIDTSGDDDSNHVRPMRELRSSNRISSNMLKQNDSDLWDSGRPKRKCIKQKRVSPDERLVFDNRNYYKVEVLSNKLRNLRERKIKSPVISEESEDDRVYNFRRKHKRTSEISRLNNEAENFLFPNKDETSTDNETDVTNASSRKKEPLSADNKPNKVCKNEIEEESSMDSLSTESSIIKKKRRLTHAEAFILDNQRYYKFETPGSRLRYQGSYLSPIAAKNNGEFGVKHSRIKAVPVEKKDSPKLLLENLKFSFEIVPNGEPWYNTFQRQDKGEECYSCYNYTSGYKPFLLPYEMGPLPPLNPRICYSVYERMKKEILCDTGPSTSEACSTPDISNLDKTDYNSSTGEDTKSSDDIIIEPVVTQKIHRRGRRRKLLGGRNPRKSPRQHASTLAILSSLLHQRKRRDFNRFRDQSLNKSNLSVIAEEKESEPEPDYDELTKSIDDMLLNTYGDIKVEDGLVNDGVNVNVHCTPNAVECLEQYIKGDDVCNGARKHKPNNVVVRKLVRKKKKNRTGWPNKNKRHVFRKEGSDSTSRDGIESASASIKNNCVDSEENSSDNNFNKRNKNKTSFSNKLSIVNNINGDVQVNKLNGELCFKNVGSTPRRKEHRESSSDNCAEVVVPSVGDKIDCVNVDLAKWENAEKLLAAKIRYEDVNNDLLFQPIVRVQKLDCNIEEKCIGKQFNVSTSKRRMPASPKSPRRLRRPRGGWYRDRY